MKQKPENVTPCIHGNLCRAYWREKHVIYSIKCPNCKFYVPKESKDTIGGIKVFVR